MKSSRIHSVSPHSVLLRRKLSVVSSSTMRMHWCSSQPEVGSFSYIFLVIRTLTLCRRQEFDISSTGPLPGRGLFFVHSGDQTSIKPGSQGLTLVISPLIALMKDQVDGLVRRGVKAANMDSTLSADRMSWVRSEVLSGTMKILYVAPER